MRHVDYLVVGGGIIGLAVAHRLCLERQLKTVVVVEKEDRVAAHQSGRNSGVIHSGVYYRPGSLKARLCVHGAARLVEFCRRHGIAHEICGKLIVATDEAELPRLRELAERARANGVTVRLLDPAQVAELEPAVTARAALHIPATGIADFPAVCVRLADLVIEAGGEVRLDTRVTAIHDGVVVTTDGEFTTGTLINCAGLYADRVARMAGHHTDVAIVPFRGEYFTLDRDLVHGLVYPVPDPALPFLGLHLTKVIGGRIHAGPNAVLALSREGYGWRRFSARDSAEVARFPGTWRLARRHARTGLREVTRSLSRRRFAADLARLVPAVTAADLRAAPAGVRAQAVRRDGTLVDDFLIVRAPGQLHVLNAPSPAATSSLAIAAHIVDQLP